MRPSFGRTLVILLILSVAVAAPVLLSGFWSLHVAAEAAGRGDYLASAQALESAAHQLPWRPGLWEAAGRSAHAAGDHARAVRLLRTAQDREKLSAAGWESLGSSLWAMSDPNGAITAWLEGARRNAQAPGLWDRLAAAYHELQDYEAEEHALRRRLSVEEDAAAYYRLGLLLMLSDAHGAVQPLDAASRLNPDVGPAASTLKAARDAAALENTPARSLVVIGRSLGLVEEWSLAAEAFRRAAEADPRDGDARAWLGEARQHLGQDGRADLDAAMLLGRNSSVVHTLRGLYWRRQGNLGLSLAEYSRAAQLAPGNAALRSLVGEAYAAGGDLVSALDSYKAAVELAPTDPTYWRMLALFCADNEVQVLDVGVAAGQKAVELAPRDAQALDALGWAYAQAGYLHRAEEPLLQAIERNPDFAPAHLHLGLTYMRWGQNDRALDHWQTAVQLDGRGPTGTLAAQLLNTYFPQP